MKHLILSIFFPVLFAVGYLGFPSWKVKESTGESARRFNPGHYVAVGVHFELSEIRHLEEPALRGINKRYFWKTLEPQKGQYDFSEIEKDLAFCAKHQKQLVVFLCDKSFWIKGAVPEYLKAFEWQNDENGFTPMRWEPEFIDRFLAVSEAIAERFGNHPNFEGIAIQETSLDIPEEVFEQLNYTPEKYRDALLTLLEGLCSSFSGANVFWYQNGIQGTNDLIRQIADSLTRYDNIIMGGPDILPHRRWLRYTYRIYGDYKEKMTLFCSAQDDSYHHHKNDVSWADQGPVHEEGYLTMEEIFLYARDEMHVQYLFWNQYYDGEANGERSFDDVVPVIRKYAEF